MPSPRLASIFRKVTGPFREFGISAGLLYAVDRVLSSISGRCRLHVYELTSQPIASEPVAPRRAGKSLEMREIRATDPEIALMPVRADAMRARLRQNATCLGAFRRGELIGYMWFCRDAYEEDEVRCTYVLADPEESVFDFDFYIFPQHRMGLAFMALWDAANALLRREKIRHTFSRMTRFNLASRRAHRHLGGSVLGRVAFLQLGRVELMIATVAPFVHFSTGGSRRARLVLRGPGEGVVPVPARTR